MVIHMTIEKINDNQIKCTLDKNDLQARNININELAYGSPKADNLFKEMTEQAHKQFGFQINDSPLMIEAVPLSFDSIALIITKVEDPGELDTRFSRFSPDSNGNISGISNNYDAKSNKATDFLSLLNSLKETLASENADTNMSFSNTSVESSTKKDLSKFLELNKHLLLVFQFDDIDKIIDLAHVLSLKYSGTNSLYKLDNFYYLTIEKAEHTPAEFNQICNIICEFGMRTSLEIISPLRIAEHGELILKDSALQDLANV